MHRYLALIVGLSACSDYDLNSRKDKTDGKDEDDTGTGSDTDTVTPPTDCELTDFPAEELGVGDTCPTEPEGGFHPEPKWHHGSGKGCLSLPVVADLDQDGLVEVIYNQTGGIFSFNAPGDLVAVDGASGSTQWTVTTAEIPYGSPPAVADLDGDGFPEIVTAREYEQSLFAVGDYTAVAWDGEGNELWESEHFVGLDFDWATAPSISDMDHDGSPEIVLGRVILNADGTTRGVGEFGRGSYGIVSVGGFTVSESSVSAVTDLDLDGTEEVIVGNAMYDPDGNAIWSDQTYDDGMIGLANLDDDPEGEFVAITYNTIRAHDTDGSYLWGPTEIPSANIVSTPGIGDLDLDGYPEIVVAGGNRLVTFNHDGTTLWSASVTDESGATGASIFDFEGDGIPEVVYIDEVEMIAYDGATGAVKFYSTEHASNTMFDYPVVADIDDDDHAEILVCHNGYDYALTAYQDADDSWATARPLWNQHAYGISNINDDLSVPTTATPNFADTNTWHSAIATTGFALGTDVTGEILEVCTDECDRGTVWVTLRVHNLSPEEEVSGFQAALYAVTDAGNVVLDLVTVDETLEPGWATAGIPLELDANLLAGATGLLLSVDDDGTGTGVFDECAETNNDYVWDEGLCE